MTTATHAQIVTFRLGDDLFAADIYSVERVLRHSAPTAVPNVPAWIEGVIDYEERVVPVLNLRSRFGLPAGVVAPETRILVFTVGDEWIAATVDGVLDVSAVDAADVEPPPPLFRGVAGDYFRGIVRRGERLVIVLDVARLLSTTERLALVDAVASEPPNERAAGAGAPAARGAPAGG